MNKLTNRKIAKSNQPVFHSNLRFKSSFELPVRTDFDNLSQLTNNRAMMLSFDMNKDLSEDEIKSVKEYHSDRKNMKRFNSPEEFIKDLYD